MKVVLSYPSSNQNVRAYLRALENAEMLALFCTTIALRRGNVFLGLLPNAIRDRLESRIFDEADVRRIRAFPMRELIHQTARRIGLPSLTKYETGWASVDAVSNAFDRSVARIIRRREVDASAIYAYEYAALSSFEAALAVGMRRFYELTIGYWRAGLRVLTEESETNPEWAATIEILHDSRAKREHKDLELQAADHVVVPSRFVRDTLREHPGMKATIDVLPYGAPPVRLEFPASRGTSSRLKVLYVGQLSQRKGISYLFAAMRSLADVATLTLVGPRAAADCPALTDALHHHTWLGTLSHQRVLEVMAEHDVFVFPSLFEGFALVILEAMAQGLPVIATVNSGGTEVIVDGSNGFIVPIRDADAIARRISELAEDRDRLRQISAAALRTAEEMSWPVRMAAFIQTIKLRLGENAA